MTPESFLLVVCVLFGVLVPAALASWLIFTWGVRVGQGLRSGRLDRARPLLNLHETDWSIEMKESKDSLPFRNGKGNLRFSQWGNRVRFEGTDADGGRWSGEGVCFGTHLSLVYMARIDGGHFIGTIELDAEDRIRKLHGTRTTWSGRPGAITIVPIQLSFGTERDPEVESAGRDEETPSVTEENARRQNATATEGPQTAGQGKVLVRSYRGL